MLKTYYVSFFSAFLFLVSCKEESPIPLAENDKHFSLIDSDFTHIKFINKLIETEKDNHLINENFVTGAGVAIGDINNDGLPDIFFSGNQVYDKLYLNKGNLVFEDISQDSGINIIKNWSTGVTFADVNADGFQDIYICKNVHQKNGKSNNLLFINNGDLTFTESAHKYGISDPGFSIQANFFDYDNDGWIDLYLINQPPGYGNRSGGKTPMKYANPRFSDKLYKNLGANKGFVDVSNLAGIKNLAHGLSASIGDVNNDNQQDIYVTNDYDKPDYLYVNNSNGTFKNNNLEAFKHISNFSMGSDIADFDNDGNLDIMVVDMVAEDHKRIKTNMGGMNPENFWAIVDNGWHHQYMFNTLHRNNGNATFSDVAQIAGVSNTDWSWGPLIADFDNDGFKDIFVTNGIKRNMRYSDVNNTYEIILDSISLEAKKQNKRFQDVVNILELAQMAPEDKLNNYIYKNNGDLTFENKIEEWGFAKRTLSNGSCYADLDLDGDLDIVVSNIDEEAFIYRNNTSERQLGNYLRFKLISENNTNIYGTRIKLFKKDSLMQMVEATNNRGYMSKSEDALHFGIGQTKNIDKAIVIWPDGRTNVFKNLKANKQIDVFSKKATKNSLKIKKQETIFKDVTQKTKLRYKHEENIYNDYLKEVLLPHKMSQFGPQIAVGDVNGDSLEDFYIGGSAGNSGSLFLQNKDGTFSENKNPVWDTDKGFEDAGCLFFDIDSDGDLDLFVASGGNEFKPNSKMLKDRLYINNGSGIFTKDSQRVPRYLISSSVVIPADYDNDGDLDLFVGGRLTPQKYPFPASSKLLENRNGYLIDVTNKVIPDLKNLGLTTSATWADINNDDLLDLIVVGEWMPVTTFINHNSTFKKQTFEGLKNTEGWYYYVTSADMDKDGDQDLIIGNLGLNYKYKATKGQPFQVHSYDFDKNGTNDIVLSYYDHGQIYPVRGRSCSLEQIPSLEEKFPTFESFGASNLDGIYGSNLKNALNFKAYTFASYYVENVEGKSFNLHKLPQMAQLSSINSMVIDDFDNDNNLDIILSGNLYGSEIETPRNDAGIGLFLKGNSTAQFKAIPLTESGFYTPNNAKSMVKINTSKSKAILVGNNNDKLQLITYK
ncbi:VCBS repeat-containing protein [uncultured Algibacter sp.]|uniref:VCBS repeat-containing protein n=1 Tax=uncultured Algibacter sp. TaxID=298659 RepID=UPI002620E6A6|nr:VCBS repeat-containing protein [uncultured Algibacter sp.]